VKGVGGEGFQNRLAWFLNRNGFSKVSLRLRIIAATREFWGSFASASRQNGPDHSQGAIVASLTRLRLACLLGLRGTTLSPTPSVGGGPIVPILPVDTLFVRVCNTLTVSVELVVMMTPSPLISALAFRFLSSSDIVKPGEQLSICCLLCLLPCPVCDHQCSSACLDNGARVMLNMAHLGFVDNIGKRNQIISPRAALRNPAITTSWLLCSARVLERPTRYSRSYSVLFKRAAGLLDS
jgi:hypothetical protein